MARDREFSVGDLAERLDAEVLGNLALSITGLNTLEDATEGDMTFIGSERHAKLWATSRASGAVVDRGIEVPDHDASSRALLIVDNADLAMAGLLSLFLNEASRPPAGISPQALVHATASIDPTATVMEWSSVGPGSSIGRNTIIEQGVHISEGCEIGDDCILRAGVVVRERCRIGNRVGIHPNAVIGADGFGYRPDGRGGLTKIPHIGTVVIEDDVEIGACTTIDRGKFGPTVIGAHSKLDNQCQIGHNVKIGRGCVMAALSGIAGSTVLGDFCQMAGQSGIADHLKIGSRVRLAAHSGIMRDTPDDLTVGGLPAIELKDYWRIHRVWSKLPEIQKAVRDLTRQVEELTPEPLDPNINRDGQSD